MKASIIAAILTLAALPLAAQTETARVDARQASQEARIQQGAQSGQLTGKETAKVEKGQARVQKGEDKAKADGKVTAKERTKLAKAQNKQSRKIAKQKHDKQKKAPAA